MKNVYAGKNYLEKILWKMWEIIEKCLVPMFKNLMTIAFVVCLKHNLLQISTKYQKNMKYIQNK